MRKITYKYNIGDTVRFKNKFHPTASCGLREVAGQVARIVDRKDYAGPAYAIEGFPNTFYKEACFAGRVVLSVDTPEGTINTEIVKQQDAETNYVTGHPGEINEAKWQVAGTFDDFLKCSNCGESWPWATAIDFQFCPRCGKYMINHQRKDEKDAI